MGRGIARMVGRLAALLVALSALPVVATWVARPGPAPRPAATGEWIRPDQVLVELREHTPASAIQDLDARYEIDLQFNSAFSQEDELLRATVDPARRDALLA